MSETLTQQVSQSIKKQIFKENYSPGTRLATEREMCSTYSVSRQTVRTALSLLEKQGLIRNVPYRGKLVSETAKDFRERTAARHTVLYARLQEPLHQEIGNGFLRIAKECGHEAVISDVGMSVKRAIDSVRHPPQKVNGMLVQLQGNPEHDKTIREAVEAGLKIVLVYYPAGDSLELSSVIPDWYAGAYEATSHLIQLHDTPVYQITCSGEDRRFEGRHEGWAHAMEEHGLESSQEYVLQVPSFTTQRNYQSQARHLEENAYRQALGLFGTVKADKYCIFLDEDRMAKGLYSAVKEAGLTVGKDVFAVGFHNHPFCERMRPQLSSIAYCGEDLGYEGGRLLFEELAGQVRKHIQKVLPVKLKVRASSTG